MHLTKSLDWLGRTDEALETLDLVTLLDPKDVDSWYRKGLIYSIINKHDKAVVQYNVAVMLSPNNENIREQLAFSYNELGELELALDSLNQYLSIKPENLNAWYAKRDMLKKLGRQKEAEECIEKIKYLQIYQSRN